MGECIFKKEKKGDRDNRRRIILFYSEQFGSKIKSPIIKVQIGNGFPIYSPLCHSLAMYKKVAVILIPLFEGKHCNGR